MRDDFSVDLPAGPGTVQARLTSHVGRRATWFHTHRDAPYGGTVSNRGFRLSRHGNVHNPFKPVATGTLHPHGSRTLVTVTVAVPGLFVGLAVASAGLVVGAVLVLFIVSFFTPSEVRIPLQALSVLASGLVLAVGGVLVALNRSQARLIRRELHDILTADWPPTADTALRRYAPMPPPPESDQPRRGRLGLDDRTGQVPDKGPGRTTRRVGLQISRLSSTGQLDGLG